MITRVESQQAGIIVSKIDFAHDFNLVQQNHILQGTDI